MQLRHVLNDKLHGDLDSHDPTEIMSLFQFITMILMSTYHDQILAVQASMHSLHDLIHIILCILLEPTVQVSNSFALSKIKDILISYTLIIYTN